MLWVELNYNCFNSNFNFNYKNVAIKIQLFENKKKLRGPSRLELPWEKMVRDLLFQLSHVSLDPVSDLRWRLESLGQDYKLSWAHTKLTLK